MAQVNSSAAHIYAQAAGVTHEGGRAGIIGPEEQLRRQVATCLLWENTFYESGDQIAKSIAETAELVSLPFLAETAVRARNDLGLRHVSLYLLALLCKRAHGAFEHPGIMRKTIPQVIQRGDEPGEFLALWAQLQGKPTSKLKQILKAQMKQGLAEVMRKFDTYQLAKYDREKVVRLRDVIFLTHAKPKDEEQAAAWKLLCNRQPLPAPDTWEVALSAGKDKLATWTRLLSENRLGALALLRNLRGMSEAGVDRQLVLDALGRAKPRGILPFQFVGALKAAPQYLSGIETMMLRALGEIEESKKLQGLSVLLVDVSGSMDCVLSNKGTMTRLEAAGALGVYLTAAAKDLRIFTFSNNLVEIPAHRGLSLITTLAGSQPHQGTYLGQASKVLAGLAKDAARVIVVTDEQSHDGLASNWTPAGYLVNVAPYKPGLMAKEQNWTRISGWSERLVDYVREIEAVEVAAVNLRPAGEVAAPEA